MVCKVCNSHGSWGPTKVTVAGKKVVVESGTFGMLVGLDGRSESLFPVASNGARRVCFMDFKDASGFMQLCLLYSSSVNSEGFVRNTLFEFMISEKCKWTVEFYDIKSDPSDKHSKGDFPVGNSVGALVGKDYFPEFMELVSEVCCHLKQVE